MQGKRVLSSEIINQKQKSDKITNDVIRKSDGNY